MVFSKLYMVQMMMVTMTHSLDIAHQVRITICVSQAPLQKALILTPNSSKFI